MTPQRTIAIYDSADELYRAAAALVAAQLAAAINERGRALVALSGGSLTTRLYPLLANPPLREQIDWSAVSVLFADERYVPFDDAENTYRATRQTLLDHVPVQAEHVFPVPTYYRDPEQAAAIYHQQTAALLAAHGGKFDVVLLGMGPDGHTASLFPRHPALTGPADRLAVVVRDAPKPPPLRISLTPAALNAARTVLFVVSGADKAAAVAAALAETGDPLDQPTRLIQPEQGNIYWLCQRMNE
ncbi:MAG: 6-phosphogluconolactonase [Chloroflexus sp.]|nr:6-phosphogluconolactonase [Chloroflexus sp.]